MNKTTWLSFLVLATFTISPALGATIQFGGEASIVANANYISQIGASQVIQWNGVNSAGGSFGASGSLTGPSGASTGAALTSTGSEALVLTSQAIVPIGAGSATTKADALPNVLGVTDPKLDAGESWSFDFDQDVELKFLVFSALNFNGETIAVTPEGGSTVSFTRTSGLMSEVTYSDNGTTNNRFVYTPAGGGLSLNAGQDLTIASTQGSWGLQAVVVEVEETTVVPEPSSTASILALMTICTATISRRTA